MKKLMTDRYNARGSIITQTLEAYRSWNPNCDIEQIRQLLWHGDEYYHTLEAKDIASLAKHDCRRNVRERPRLLPPQESGDLIEHE